MELPADLAPKYARTLLAKRGEMGLPNLVAVTAGPFLRADGSVLDERGYDEATQVLYCPTGPAVPSVRRELTVAMAAEVLQRPTVQAVIAKLLTERPTRLRTLRDTIPEGIDNAVAKALAKVPADRFTSAAAFAEGLSRERGPGRCPEYYILLGTIEIPVHHGT